MADIGGVSVAPDTGGADGHYTQARTAFIDTPECTGTHTYSRSEVGCEKEKVCLCEREGVRGVRRGAG